MRKAISSLPIIMLCIVAGASLGQPDTGDAGPGIAGPVIVEMNPSGIAPLTGLVQFTTDQPMRVSLTISDDQHDDSTVTPIDAFNTEHELMLLGLRPNRTQHIAIDLEDSDGASRVAASFDVTTEALPYWLPPIETRVSNPERMEPGVTLLGVFNDNDPTFNFTVGLDAEGGIVWFREGSMDEPRRLQNGNLLAITDGIKKNDLQEIDMLGRVVRAWRATGTNGILPEGVIPVATDTFHHDVLEMPSGNFLAISSEIRHLESYPTSWTDDTPRAPHDVIADRIIEFRPDDGAIVREWKMADLYDKNRLAHGALATDFYGPPYESVLDEPLPDWTHTNGFYYDAATDSIIASIRKMSAIVKIDLAANKLAWILGNSSGWSPEFAELLLEPVGDITWTFGQHAPELTPDGTLLVFDNGSYGRAYPTDEGQSLAERYSRAVEFAIDEDAGTVRQVWSYGGPGSEHFYSEFVSEADRLPITGNTLIDAGGQMVTGDGEQTDDFEAGRVWVAVKEVTTTTSPENVWEIVIDDPRGEWGSYRAERMPSLYPEQALTQVLE